MTYEKSLKKDPRDRRVHIKCSTRGRPGAQSIKVKEELERR